MLAIDAGEARAIEGFVERHPTPPTFNGTTKDGLRALLRNAHTDSGGVELVAFDARGTRAFMRLKSKKSGRMAAATFELDEKGNPNGFEMWPLRNDGVFKPNPFPAGKFDSRGVIREVRRYLAKLAKEDAFSGTVLIAQGDRVLMHTAQGLADRKFGVPVTKETKFHLASVGKLFTTAIVGQLVQEGKLGLEDVVGKHLPDYPDPAVRDKVTIRHLLSHTAGTGSVFGSPGYDRNRRYANAGEMTSALKDEALLFPPGSSWSYSNGGYVVLGAIAERITGRDYRSVASERVWRPLGMTSTDIVGDKVIVPGLASIYDRDPLDPFGVRPMQHDAIQYGWIGGPHGGGHSTAMDLFRLARGFMSHRLLRQDTLATLLTAPNEPAKRARFVSGFETLDVAGQRVFGHGGHNRAEVSMFPELDVTVVVLGNDLYNMAPPVSRRVCEFIAKNAASFRRK